LRLARAREPVRDRADHDDQQCHRDERLDKRVAGLLESTAKRAMTREAAVHHIEGSARTRDIQPPFGGRGAITSGLKSDSQSADAPLQWRRTWGLRRCNCARSAHV